MKLEHRELPQADGSTKRITTILDNEGNKNAKRLEFLETLLNNPNLAGAYETLIITHNGKSWQAETEITLKGGS